MRTALTAVLDTHQCDPQHWLGHMLSSHPAYCTTVIEQCVITVRVHVIGEFNGLYLVGVRKVKRTTGMVRTDNDIV